jgi:hypothetical protein
MEEVCGMKGLLWEEEKKRNRVERERRKKSGKKNG